MVELASRFYCIAPRFLSNIAYGGYMSGWYNGYSPEQRHAKSQFRKKQQRTGKVFTYPPGPCSMCADPAVDTEPHSEDYSTPYSWEEPAVYSLCRTCHRNKLHKRFSSPYAWKTWQAHIRRGGRSTDLSDPVVITELRRFQKLLEAGAPITLKQLRPRKIDEKPWWEKLTLDPTSLTDPAFGPRPLPDDHM